MTLLALTNRVATESGKPGEFEMSMKFHSLTGKPVKYLDIVLQSIQDGFKPQTSEPIRWRQYLEEEEEET